MNYSANSLTYPKDGKNKHLGYFADIQDAIKARKEAEKKYFGEFAYSSLNGQ